MSVSSRVKDDDNFLDHIPVKGGMVGVVACGKRFRLYEVNDYYSSTSGGVAVKGKMIRRYDPEARELEGKPAQFPTVDEAVTYAKRWLSPSLKLK